MSPAPTPKKQTPRKRKLSAKAIEAAEGQGDAEDEENNEIKGSPVKKRNVKQETVDGED